MKEGYQLKLSKDEARALKEAISYFLEERPQEETNQHECLMLSGIHQLLVKYGA
jgi:hypothetical protein